MKKFTILMMVVTVITAMLAIAAPGVAFAGNTGNDFVCPVLNSVVGAHNPNAVPIAGGDYTVAPAGAKHLNVPDHATNMNGLGSPAGLHAKPGDTNYSAIWNGDAVPIPIP